jgi:purine-binding chemotaxis protein CheW
LGGDGQVKIGEQKQVEKVAEDAAPGAAEPRLRSDYCVFVRDGITFALSTHVAREVLDARPFTPVPQAPSELLGAFNLRGEVIPLVRFDRFLAVPGREHERTDPLLLLSHGEFTLAAVVDQVVTIKHIPPWELQRAEPAQRERNALVRGTVGKDDQQILILDGERLLAAVAHEIASGFRRRPALGAAPALAPAPPRGPAGAGVGGTPTDGGT